MNPLAHLYDGTLFIALLPLSAVFAGFVAIGWFTQRAATGMQKILRFVTGMLLLSTAIVFVDGQIAVIYIVAAVFFGATSFVVERRYRASIPIKKEKQLLEIVE